MSRVAMRSTVIFLSILILSVSRAGKAEENVFAEVLPFETTFHDDYFRFSITVPAGLRVREWVLDAPTNPVEYFHIYFPERHGNQADIEISVESNWWGGECETNDVVMRSETVNVNGSPFCRQEQCEHAMGGVSWFSVVYRSINGSFLVRISTLVRDPCPDEQEMRADPPKQSTRFSKILSSIRLLESEGN